MTVHLNVHIESTDDGRQIVWWASSPDLPGFSAAADSLLGLQMLARDAIVEIFSEEGRAGDVELALQLVSDEPLTAGSELRVEGVSPPANAGSEGRHAMRELAIA